MTDTCRLYRLGLLTRMPLCLGKWIPVVIAILTVIADEMDE